MSVSTLSLPQSVCLVQRTFTRRSQIPLDHDFLWRIDAGVVRTLTVLEDGTLATLGLWGPGDIVGRALSKAQVYQIECLTSVKASPLPTHTWHQFTEAIILHIQQVGELMEILHYRQTESSLLRLFSWLGKRFGQEVEQGQLIDLNLTHQDIADLIGVTRVTVTRLVNEFEKQGLIQRVQRQFIVLPHQLPFWYYEI